ncbi:MAG: hydroxymethylglutaryl-CoA lyase, partial [Elusimicrobia bacterium CG08_land_8_20_14_0_20_59_10]
HEVGLRDGLQMESRVVPLEKKAAWLSGLLESGIDIVQAGSFVHPVKVPQMADTDELFRRFTAEKKSPAILSGLVLNEKGLERGLACGVEMFCLGASASETHSKKNTGMGTDEAVQRIIGAAKSALSAGKKVQVSVQSAFGCGFEGPIPEERVLKMVRAYVEAGLLNISLAD